MLPRLSLSPPSPVSVALPPRLVCVDLGQANDFTAVVVLTPSGGSSRTYTAGHIERVPLNTRYTTVRDHVARLIEILRAPDDSAPVPLVRLPGAGIMRGKPARSDVTLLLDFTGVGRPVLDMFLEAQNPPPAWSGGRIDPDVTIVPVTITGQEHPKRGPGGDLLLPKKDLASVVQVVLQERRLIIPDTDPMAAVLTGELTGFRAKIGTTGHVTYAAAEDWRSGNPGNHDDLVLSLALGLWYGENAMPAE